jgi:hypothetical protein
VSGGVPGGGRPGGPDRDCPSGCGGGAPGVPPAPAPAPSAGSGGGANGGAGGGGGQPGVDNGGRPGAVMKPAPGAQPQQPNGQVVKNKDPRTGLDPPAGTAAPSPNPLVQKPDQPGADAQPQQNCQGAAGGCPTPPVPGPKPTETNTGTGTEADTAGLTPEQKEQYQLGSVMAQDRNDFAQLVPGYNPAVPPTREQLIQAGIAQQQHLRDLRATGEVTDDPGWLDRHLPHVPDAHKVFGDLSYVPFPEIGSAAALTDAYAYYTEGRTKEAGEALLGVVPMGKYLGPLGKGAKVAGEFVLGESRAEPKPAPGIRPPDPEAGPAAQPRPEPAPKPAAPKPADDPGQPAGAPAPHLVPRPGVGQPKSDAPGAPAGATPRGGVGRGPAGGAGKAPTGNAGAGPRGRTNPRATGRDDTAPPNAMAGARPGGPTKGEPLTNSANSNRRGPETPGNDTPRTAGPGQRSSPRNTSDGAPAAPRKDPQKAADQPVNPEAAGGGEKLPWTTWQNYPKVTHQGREYAAIGDRLYARHAVDRLQPSGRRHRTEKADPGLGSPAGDGRVQGRSISPTFVEHVITSTKGAPVKGPNGEDRLSHVSGSVQVITEEGDHVVVTVMTR